MKWIPARMGQTFVLTIQIGLCVAKPESAASIRFGGQHGPSKSRQMLSSSEERLYILFGFLYSYSEKYFNIC